MGHRSEDIWTILPVLRTGVLRPRIEHPFPERRVYFSGIAPGVIANANRVEWLDIPASGEIAGAALYCNREWWDYRPLDGAVNVNRGDSFSFDVGKIRIFSNQRYWVLRR